MISNILKDNPETWGEYVGRKNGLFDVIKMEFEELEQARREGSHKQIIEELSHVAAAAQNALDKMTCN